MARETIYMVQPSFGAGELAPEVASRIDLDKYQNALLQARNAYIRPYGSVYKRGGTLYCGETYDTGKIKLKEFKAPGGAYLLEFGNRYLRIWKNGHPMDGMLDTPYIAEELDKLRMCQSADVMFIASGTHPIMKLSRYSDGFKLHRFDIKSPYFDSIFSSDDVSITVDIKDDGHVSLHNDKALFTPDMEGTYIEIQQEVEARTVSLSGRDTSEALLCGKSWKIITHGTWKGKITIEKRKGKNGEWKTFRTYTADEDFNAAESGTVDEHTWFRVKSETNKANTDFTVLPYTHKSVIKLTSIYSDKAADGSCEQSPAENVRATYFCRDAWNKEFGYPETIGFFQDRLCLGATKKQPYMMWMSRSGDYGNFSVDKVGGTVTDDSAIALAFINRNQQTLKHLCPESDLIIMTGGNEWILSGANTLTPTKANPKQQTSRGCTDVVPLSIGGRLIFIQHRGKTVRDMQYNFESDSYDGQDLTLLAKHITKDREVVDMAYMQDPDSRMYFVLSDGSMACLSYVRDQKIYAWSQFVTQGSIIAVCNVEEPNKDGIYIVVRRKGRQLIERLEQADAGSNLPADYIMMDSAMKIVSEHETGKGQYHLSNTDIGVLADGRYYTTKTDSNGYFTIPGKGFSVVVGLLYNMKVELPNIEMATQMGTLQGRKKKVAAATLRLVNSLGGWIGIEEKNIIPIKYEEFSNQEIKLYSGDKRITMPNKGFELTGRIVIISDEPYPFNLSAVIREVVLDG